MNCFTELDRLVVSIQVSKDLKVNFGSFDVHMKHIYTTKPLPKSEGLEYYEKYTELYNSVASMLGLESSLNVDDVVDWYNKKHNPVTGQGLQFPSREHIRRSKDQDEENVGKFKEGDEVFLIKDANGKVALVGNPTASLYNVLAVLSDDELTFRFKAYTPLTVSSSILENKINIENVFNAPKAKVTLAEPVKTVYGNNIQNIEPDQVQGSLNAIATMFDDLNDTQGTIPLLSIATHSNTDEDFLLGRPVVKMLTLDNNGHYKMVPFQVALNKAALSTDSPVYKMMQTFYDNAVILNNAGFPMGSIEFETLIKDVAKSFVNGEILSQKKNVLVSKYGQSVFDSALQLVQLTHGQEKTKYRSTSLVDFYTTVGLNDNQIQKRKEQLKNLFDDFQLTDEQVDQILNLNDLLSGKVFEIVFGIKNSDSPRTPKTKTVEKDGQTYLYTDLLEQFRKNIQPLLSVETSAGGRYELNRVGDKLEEKQKIKGVRTPRTIFTNRNTITKYENGKVVESYYSPPLMKNGYGPLQKALKQLIAANQESFSGTSKTEGTYVHNLLKPFFTTRGSNETKVFITKGFFTSDDNTKKLYLKGIFKTLRALSKDYNTKKYDDLEDMSNLESLVEELDIIGLAEEDLEMLSNNFSTFYNTERRFESLKDYIDAELEQIQQRIENDKINLSALGNFLDQSHINPSTKRFKKDGEKKGSFIRSNPRLAGEINDTFEKQYIDLLSLAYTYHTNPEFKSFMDNNPFLETGFKLKDETLTNTDLLDKINSMHKETVISEFEKLVSSNIETSGVIRIENSKVDIDFNSNNTVKEESVLEEPAPSTQTAPVSTNTKADIERRRQEKYNTQYNNLVSGNVLDNQGDPVFEEDKGIGANGLFTLTEKKYGHGHVRTSGLNSLKVLEDLLEGAEFSGWFGEIGEGPHSTWETGNFIIVSNNIYPIKNGKLNLNEVEIILNAGLTPFAQELANKYPNVIIKDFNGKKYDAELDSLEDTTQPTDAKADIEGFKDFVKNTDNVTEQDNSDTDTEINSSEFDVSYTDINVTDEKEPNSEIKPEENNNEPLDPCDGFGF